MACPIFHHLDCYIRTNRAFKSTFIVVRLVRLDAGEPHLCLADFAKRATDDPLLRKILVLSHTTPRFFGYGRLMEAQLRRQGPRAPRKRLQRLLVKVTTVRQLDDHCLTFRVRRF